jgi:hypothetical protein
MRILTGVEMLAGAAVRPVAYWPGVPARAASGMEWSRTEQVVTVGRWPSWGWLPALSLTSALGLALVSLAVSGARTNADWAVSAYWAGLVALFTPVAFRLLAPGAARAERIVLLQILGLGTYLVKTLRSPLAFKGFDELLHVRSMSDLLMTGRLFHENSLLPASPFFPGLEIVSHAFSTLGGLAIFPSGVVVVGLARCAFVLALYLIFEQVAHSPRTASVATLLYIANPSFTYFDTAFAYESLALPLAAFSLFVIARGAARRAERGWRLAVPALLAIGATVITHHVTSYVLLVF